MPAPLRVLCQHDGGSCAACCGVYNFRDRSARAERERLERRTARVRAAWPDRAALAAARDALLEIEKPDVLFAAVKVCPFAGYVDDDAPDRGTRPGATAEAGAGRPTAEGDDGRSTAEVDEARVTEELAGRRVGCLLHPTRHPAGEDLRDLAVYPREVCAGHFCAPHDWLRPREVDLAQAARGTGYGRVVTDAGLVKAVAALLDGALGRPFRKDDVVRGRDALASLWWALLDWPWADADPARFGGFLVTGDDAVERTLPHALAPARLAALAPGTNAKALAAVLDGLGTRALDDAEAARAVASLHARIAEAAAAMSP